jgi:hypothetical protein
MHCLHSLFCQSPNCNLFTQHVIYLYGETPLVNCGPRSILLHSYYRLLFTSIIYFLANNYLLPHDTFNPLFTANRWDWQPHCKLGQSTLVVLYAGSTLLLVQSYAPDKALYINCLELSPSQLASTLGSWFFLLLVRYTLVLYWGKTCCYAHHTFLLGFPTGCLPHTISSQSQETSMPLLHEVVFIGQWKEWLDKLWKNEIDPDVECMMLQVMLTFSCNFTMRL